MPAPRDVLRHGREGTAGRRSGDLNGADYEKRLIWRSDDGLGIKPYYRAEDLKDSASGDAAPGAFPYRRGGRATGDWRIREEIDEKDAKSANRAACDAIAGGAEEIAFGGVGVEGVEELNVLLANLDEIPVRFERADEHVTRSNGRLAARRREQQRRWMREMIDHALRQRFDSHPAVRGQMEALEREVAEGRTTSFRAAQILLAAYSDAERG